MKRWMGRTGAAVILAVSILGATSGPAGAITWGNSPVVYRDAGNHYTPMYGMPDTDQYTVVTQWLSPGEPFWADCYTDVRDAYHYKNYSTVRWFRGWSKWHGWGYVHASFVYYQYKHPVGRC